MQCIIPREKGKNHSSGPYGDIFPEVFLKTRFHPDVQVNLHGLTPCWPELASHKVMNGALLLTFSDAPIFGFLQCSSFTHMRVFCKSKGYGRLQVSLRDLVNVENEGCWICHARILRQREYREVS